MIDIYADIDWFFTNGQKIGFAASAGGVLPKSITELRDIELLSSYFRDLPTLSDFQLSAGLNSLIPNGVINERYLSDFVFMATKGLFAYDKTNPSNTVDPNYHLVAYPAIFLDFNTLPDDIKSIVTKTRIDGDMTAAFNVHSVT